MRLFTETQHFATITDAAVYFANNTSARIYNADKMRPVPAETMEMLVAHLLEVGSITASENEDGEITYA